MATSCRRLRRRRADVCGTAYGWLGRLGPAEISGRVPGYALVSPQHGALTRSSLVDGTSILSTSTVPTLSHLPRTWRVFSSGRVVCRTLQAEPPASRRTAQDCCWTARRRPMHSYRREPVFDDLDMFNEVR